MKSNDELVKEVDEVISQGLAQYPLPYQKGNSIRLKNIIIRNHKNGYRLFDCHCNKHVITLFSKTAALAYAKLFVTNKKNDLIEIKRLDDKLNKHYMDALYAKRTISNSKDPVRVENAEIMYDIATERVYSIIDAIENYIFDK